MSALRICPTMDEFTYVNNRYVRASHTSMFGPVTISATAGSGAIVSVTKQLIFDQMISVWIEGYGNSSSYANTIHIYDWTAGTNSLTIRFCGDKDTYTPLYIGMLWR